MVEDKIELMPGLYGSSISKNRAVGYCHFHKAALTVKTMKCKECLRKQCDALERYGDHDFWRQHAQKKVMKKAKKQILNSYYV